jgi:hypothetical protein
MDARRTTRPRNNAARPEDRALRFLLSVLGVVAAVGGLFIAFYWLQPAAPTPLRVTVELDNQCELVDDAFMAVSEPDGQRAYFANRVAILETRSDAYVAVRASDRYPGVAYESSRVSAASNLRFTVNCGLSERVERTLDALRDRFQSK